MTALVGSVNFVALLCVQFEDTVLINEIGCSFCFLIYLFSGLCFKVKNKTK